MNYPKSPIYCLLIALLTLATEARATETATPVTDRPQLTACIDKNLGFKVNCSPDWQRDVKSDTVRFLLQNHPHNVATLSVTKFANQNKAMTDLTPSFLRSRFEYCKDFKMGHSEVGGRKAIMAMAQPLGFPDVQLIDYFVIKGDDLYRISFSVTTRDRLKEYQPLFAELIHSFEFQYVEEPALTLKQRDSSSTNTEKP